MSGAGLAAGALITAAGTGVSMYAQNKNAKNQQNQLAASEMQQGNLEREASAKVAQTTARAAAANPNNESNNLLAAYKSALSAAAPTSGAINPVAGGSKRYAESTASAKSNVGAYADEMAKNMATTGGAQLQRIDTGNDIANTASQLGLLDTQSVNDQAVLKAQLEGDTPNPWLTALGSIAQGAGQGMMGRGLTGSMGAQTPGVAAPAIGPGSSLGASNMSFLGEPVTPAYSTGFNSAVASNPYLR